MTHPMVERLARAIAEANEEDFEDAPNLYVAMATSALQPLLEPDEQMVEAMARETRDDLQPTDDELRAFFTAAIRSLLEEK
jgi:hypothetical protein